MVFERYLRLIVEVPLSFFTLTKCKFSKILVFTCETALDFKKIYNLYK